MRIDVEMDIVFDFFFGFGNILVVLFGHGNNFVVLLGLIVCLVSATYLTLVFGVLGTLLFITVKGMVSNQRREERRHRFWV